MLDNKIIFGKKFCSLDTGFQPASLKDSVEITNRMTSDDINPQDLLTSIGRQPTGPKRPLEMHVRPRTRGPDLDPDESRSQRMALRSMRKEYEGLPKKAQVPTANIAMLDQQIRQQLGSLVQIAVQAGNHRQLATLLRDYNAFCQQILESIGES
ncbi:MAG: hypothetical protein KDK39_00790 [Leptospiraceae bacterium]|nr:hypothetical protein [Leptospiraceae bacterium]